MNLGMKTLAVLVSTALIAPLVAATVENLPPTLTGIFVDAADGNRFFTRVGGIAEDRLTYTGLNANEAYQLESRLVVVGSGVKGDPVVTNFTPTSSTGDVVVTFPVAPNRTDFNIDYVSEHNLYKMIDGNFVLVLSVTGDSRDPNRTIQVHAIQRLKISKVQDAVDGDRRIDGQGGNVWVRVRYENMVEGYAYTIWGQLLTPSGQAIGVFASIPRYAPVGKNGHVQLTFTVPPGYEGIKLVPSVGIYHHNRVTIAENGNIYWNLGAPNPVMIASDTKLSAKARTIEVGVPF